MRNVFFIGDCHLKNNSPISRIDDFSKSILNKLLYLVSIAECYKCNTFIILGDLFDSPITTLQHLASVIDVFKKIKEAGITVYTIVGNHDIKNNRIESLESTALGILIASNYIKLAPRTLVIENTVFKCYNYPDEIESKNMHDAYQVNTDLYEVCVAHRYYEFALDNYSLHEDDVINLNYDAMILGHYHVPCDTCKIGNTILYRPGSLARNTSEAYNRTRIPRVLIFNCKNHKADYVAVECLPGSDVFVDVDKNDVHSFSMKDLVNFITSSYAESDMDIRTYFNSLQLPIECKIKVSKYLDQVGV